VIGTLDLCEQFVTRPLELSEVFVSRALDFYEGLRSGPTVFDFR
jgi:hypothetical protein